MDRHIAVIGIDHGWSNMKTVSQVYYKVGGKRLEVRDLKIEKPSYVLAHGWHSLALLFSLLFLSAIGSSSHIEQSLVV